MIDDAGGRPGFTTEKDSQLRGLSLAIKDVKVWYLAFGLTCFVFSLSFNSYFPTLTATLGSSPTVTLLLCSPPWLISTIVAFLTARYTAITN